MTKRGYETSLATSCAGKPNNANRLGVANLIICLTRSLSRARIARAFGAKTPLASSQT
jgi:hypothetical protein